MHRWESLVTMRWLGESWFWPFRSLGHFPLPWKRILFFRLNIALKPNEAICTKCLGQDFRFDAMCFIQPDTGRSHVGPLPVIDIATISHMVKLMVKDGALVCRYVKLLAEFFYGHQAQVQAAEAAARFAQEWGRVEIGKDTKGLWKCAVYERLVRESPMMPGAGPSGRRSATACCCAGLCWLGLYGRGQGWKYHKYQQHPTTLWAICCWWNQETS